MSPAGGRVERMGEVIRADAALLAEAQAGDGATLHTASGAVVSWAALHLLAAHGFVRVVLKFEPSGNPPYSILASHPRETING